MKYMFETYGKPTWYIDRLIYTYPLMMALKFIAPELVQKTSKGFCLVDRETLFREISEITGQRITNEDELNEVIENHEKENVDRTIQSHKKIM